MENQLIVQNEFKPPILKNNINNIIPRKSDYKITIRKMMLPEENNFNEKIAWICASLGFFEDIDKNKNAANIFKEIFISSTQGQVLTSTTISERVGMSRGCVINHLNKLEHSGLIEKGGKYYFTRHRTMKGIIEEIEDDLLHIFNRMKKVSEKIDSETNQTIIMK
jgi:predicted transcriptional regulator